MPNLKIKDDYLVVSLSFWEGLFWPVRNLEVPFENIESVTVENKMPCSVLCKKRPVANIPGVICIGVFYPEGSIKESQLWCFTKKHRSFLNLVLKNGNYKKIVFGTSYEQAREWCSQINEILQILNPKSNPGN